jgi:hypothetical protein
MTADIACYLLQVRAQGSGIEADACGIYLLTLRFIT